jgi:predicted cation transporter
MSLVRLGETKDRAERYVDGRSLTLYFGVLVALAIVAYLLHRGLGHQHHEAARRQASIDVLISGIVTAPGLLATIVLAGTIYECRSGCP